MGLALEFLGLALPGTTMVAADELEQRTAHAAEAGRWRCGSPATAHGARSFLQRRSLLNAFAGIAASGGSTNGVLHTLAISREAGVPLTLDDLFAHAANVPVIASLTPGGRYVATEFQEVGGVPVLIRELIRAGLVDGAAPVVTGGTLAEAVAAAPDPDGRVTFTCDAPYKTSSGLRGLRGNLAPDGAVAKISGTERRRHTGPARVFDSEEACIDRRERRRDRPRRRADHPQRGARPAGRECARCWASPPPSSARGSASPSCSSPTPASRGRRAA